MTSYLVKYESNISMLFLILLMPRPPSSIDWDAACKASENNSLFFWGERIEYLCQTYHPIVLFSVGISSNGRIFGRIMDFSVGFMIKPPDCSLSISTSTLFCQSVSLAHLTSTSKNEGACDAPYSSILLIVL